MRPLLYLECRQLANLVRITLRTPKRLIPTVLFIVWIGFFVLMQAFAATRGMNQQPPIVGQLVEMMQSILLFVTIWISLGAIAHAFSNSLIIYSQAEMDVLIAMPIDRRIIMGLKLGAIYAKFALLLALMGVFIGMQASRMVASIPILDLVAWLSIVLYAITIINLSTVINLIVAHGTVEKRWQKRSVQALGLGILVLAGATVYGAYARTGDAASAIAALIHQPILVWLAAPAVWVSGLALAGINGWQPAHAWQLAALGTMAIGTMAMVLARKENPYEPSLAASTRSALIREAKKSGDVSRLRTELARGRKHSTATIVTPFGRGATAILWKNMLLSLRMSRSAMIGALIVIPVAALLGRAVIRDRGLLALAPQAMTGIALYMSYMLAMFMGQMLRADLKQVNILKPMPISPWWLMVAETANAGLMVWALIWLLFGSAVFLLGAPTSDLMIISGVALPFVAYGTICSQTTVAVLYPNWGDMSQQWIANLLSMLFSVLSIGPPLAVGAILWLLHAPPAMTASAVIAVALTVAAGGITLGAATYRIHDPTDE
ncbi:MAG: hypothetical protein KBC96_08900 [Armatimonadetes bacterium]|nr:hypothetical protein [Armatimonadota bacterium]